MTEIQNTLLTVLSIIERMAVTGQNQEYAVAAKAQIRKILDSINGGEQQCQKPDE